MEHPDAAGEDFNLSTAESTTVRELAELIWRKIKGADVPLRIVNDEPFAYDVQRRVPDVEKAKRILGFEATTIAGPDARRGHPVDRRGRQGRADVSVPIPRAARGRPAWRRR